MRALRPDRETESFFIPGEMELESHEESRRADKGSKEVSYLWSGILKTLIW